MIQKQINLEGMSSGLDGLCKILKCSKPTAIKIKRAGKIPFVQIGKKTYYEPNEVLRSLKIESIMNYESEVKTS